MEDIVHSKDSNLLAKNGGTVAIVLSRHWARSIMERMNFVKRRGNSKSKTFPPSLKEMAGSGNSLRKVARDTRFMLEYRNSIATNHERYQFHAYSEAPRHVTAPNIFINMMSTYNLIQAECLHTWIHVQTRSNRWMALDNISNTGKRMIIRK